MSSMFFIFPVRINASERIAGTNGSDQLGPVLSLVLMVWRAHHMACQRTVGGLGNYYLNTQLSRSINMYVYL